MDNYPIPPIGSSGTYKLKAPLVNLISPNEKYTCFAIRNISEYIATNEDAKTVAYLNNGLTENNYNTDYKEDAIIVSLKSDTGHWLYLPVKYIESYPITNGIPYRAVMIGASLPSIPVSKDLGYIETAISNLVEDYIGIAPVVKSVETSRVALISKTEHDQLELTRAMNINNNTTDSAKYNKLLIDYQSALEKISALEQFIMDNHI